MKPTDLFDWPQITRKAIREIPKSWQKINQTYLQQISNREIAQLNILAIIVGIGTGYGAMGFRYFIGFLQNVVLHNNWDYHMVSPLQHVRENWLFVILPLGLLISALVTKYFASETKGHGVPEVIEAVWTKGGRIRKRVVALKALTSGITIASGGSVGREGPIVQIGSALGSSLGQIFNMQPKLLKTLVGCGAAGAIAATFNTPIGGVIFAIEIIVLELKTKSFVPLVISSVFATVVSRLHLGNEPAFFVPEYALKGPKELVFYLILGLLAGVVGVLVIKILYGFEDYFDYNLKIPFWAKPLLAGVILAAIARQYPEMMGVGYDTITSVLQQNSEFSLMLALVFIKIISMSLTLAGGGSGGVFAPSLFIGAMLGGSYGYMVHQWFPDITSSYGAYALVGMAALFSATGRATFTAIVILFEMTLDYSIILPLMFVCVTADQMAWFLSKESIYSQKLRRKGLNFVTDISVNVMSMTLVKDIMTTELHNAYSNMTVQEASDKLLHYNHSVYPVVDPQSTFNGMISQNRLSELVLSQPQSLLSEVMEEVKAVVAPENTVFEALTKIEASRDPRVFVVDPKTRKLLGIVSPIDFVRLSSSQLDGSPKLLLDK